MEIKQMIWSQFKNTIYLNEDIIKLKTFSAILRSVPKELRKEVRKLGCWFVSEKRYKEYEEHLESRQTVGGDICYAMGSTIMPLGIGLEINDIVPDDKIVLDIECGSTDPDRIYVGILGEEERSGMIQGYDGIW